MSFLKLINNSSNEIMAVKASGYFILSSLFLLSLASIEKIYQTLQTVFDHISKHLQVRYK